MKSNAICEVPSNMLLVNDNYIIEHKALDWNDLVSGNVLFIYMHNMWGFYYDYKEVLCSVISYNYGTRHYERRSNQMNLNEGVYYSVARNFITHRVDSSKGNVVRYP